MLPTFVSPPCCLGACLPRSLARSWVTDQNPLLSAYRLHLALIVWKDHLHVCDEEIIDIFSSRILCECQSPRKPSVSARFLAVCLFFPSYFLKVTPLQAYLKVANQVISWNVHTSICQSTMSLTKQCKHNIVDPSIVYALKPWDSLDDMRRIVISVISCSWKL